MCFIFFAKKLVYSKKQLIANCPRRNRSTDRKETENLFISEHGKKNEERMVQDVLDHVEVL